MDLALARDTKKTFNKLLKIRLLTDEDLIQINAIMLNRLNNQIRRQQMEEVDDNE